MLIRDQVEPLAMAIWDALSYTGFVGGLHADYHDGEDLRPEAMIEDDLVAFRRSSPKGQGSKRHGGVRRYTEHTFARLELFNIRSVAPSPGDIKYGDLIVLKSSPRAEAALELDNLRSSQQGGPLEWFKEYATGENEVNAIAASWKLETSVKASASVKAGAGLVEAEASIETETKNTLGGELSRQTGRSEDTKEGGRFTQHVNPHTYLRAHLEWNEQDLQRRWSGKSVIDCGIRVGNFQDYSKRGHRVRRWTSGSPLVWDSIEQLLAVMEKRGSVHSPGYEYFASHFVHPALIPRIQARRTTVMDRLTDPFKGASSFKVVIEEEHGAE